MSNLFYKFQSVISLVNQNAFFLLRGVEIQQSSIGILELGVDVRESGGVNSISSHLSILVYSIVCKKMSYFCQLRRLYEWGLIEHSSKV